MTDSNSPKSDNPFPDFPFAAEDRPLKRRSCTFGFLVITFIYIIVSGWLLLFFKGQQQIILPALLMVFAGMMGAYLLARMQDSRISRRLDQAITVDVLEGSRSARMISDAAGNVVYANAKCRELFGEDSSIEALKKIILSSKETDGGKAGFVAAETFDHIQKMVQDGKNYESGLSTEIDGKDVRLHIFARPISGWEGHVHWGLEDVTESYWMQRALKKEQEKLQDFTDNAPVGFFSVDENGRFIFANKTLARRLGMDVKTLMREKTLHDILKEPPKGSSPYDITADGGPKQVAEHPMKVARGMRFLASISQSVVAAPDGTVRTRGVVNDLTTERQMKAALAESEDKFQKLFDEAPLGIVLVNPNLSIHECNETFAEMAGRTRDDIEGDILYTCVALEDQDKVSKFFDMMKQKNKDDAEGFLFLDMALSVKDGKPQAARMYAKAAKETGNIVLHFIDLTEQRNLEIQFAQSQKMQAVGQLAGGVAHDFNNLLTAMIGFCDLLLLRHKAGDPSFADIMQIKQNGNRAANLVRQLLAFSRQQTLQPKVLDITDTLAELSHLMGRLIGAGIELDLLHGRDLGLIKVDEGQLEQVLINLVVNARDAMENKGHLTIHTDNYTNTKPVKMGTEKMPAGDWIKIDVIDTGCGIPKKIQERIFEPFFTTKEVGAGTGLGLATVYGIVRQTGGFLGVSSKVNKGTTFTIYLPRYSETESEKAASEAAPVVAVPAKATDLTGMATIMLVEDEEAVRAFSHRALTNKGYKVIDASSGVNALELLERENPELDLLVTDVVMPEMDGPTMVEKILETRPDLKVIFISGYTEEKLKDTVEGEIHFLPKPFTLKQLAEKIKEVLES